MNLLDLMVKIGVDDQASNRIQSISAGVIAKGNLIADAVGAAVGSIGNLASAAFQAGSAAVNAYAQYEQLVGGVDTLYKNASGKLQGYADKAFQTANLSANKYMEIATSFAGALVQSTSSSASEATEAGTAALESALEEQAKALQKAQNAEYKGLQRALSRQASEYSRYLNSQVAEVQKANARQLKDLQKAQAQEVKEYERTTNAAVKEYERRRDEALRLLDEESRARTKAIDDEISALEDQADAEDQAAKDAENAEKRSQLERRLLYSETASQKREAQKELAKLDEEIAKQTRDAARKQRIEQLKEQKDAIRDEVSERKDAVREQYSAEIEAYRESRADMLAAMREAQAEQVDAMRDSQAAQVDAMRQANEERLTAMREAQQDELDALRESQQDQLDALKESQAEQMALAEQSSAAAGGIANASAESYEKAADLADLAIKDMSDNANKMGTDIGRIQDAYMGFSRQNYVMLDNLKLGYGGTKTEMERLLQDAEAVKRSHGELADYSVDNFGDIVEAIHVMQEEMGIAGTTTEESATTILGSMAMMRASWENFLVALTSPDADLGAATDQLMESVLTVGENLIPRIGVLVDRVGEFLQEHAPEAIDKFVESAKTFLAEHFGVTEEDLGGFMDTVQSVLQGAVGVISFFTDFGGAVNGVKEAVEAFLLPFEEHLGPAIEYISGQWAEFTEKIGEGEEATEDSNTGINRWIEAAGRVLMGILGSIINIVGSVVEAVNLAIDAWNGFKETIGRVVDGIREFVETAGRKFEEFKEAVDEKVQEVIEFFENLPENIVTALGDVGTMLLDVGGDIVQGLIDGITGAPGNIANALIDVVGGGIDGLKSFLGIASPSKLFRQLGEYTMEGMEQGIEGEARSVVKTMRGVASDVYGAAEGSVAFGAHGKAGGAVPAVNVYIGEFVNNTDRDARTLAQMIGHYTADEFKARGLAKGLVLA